MPRLLQRDAELPPCDGKITALHRYWRSIAPHPGDLPSRQHFDPMMVPRLLPWLWLIDVIHDPLRFKYRLIGTVHVEAAGWNGTGLWLDQAHPKFVDSIAFPQFCAVANEGVLAFYSGPPTYVIKKDYIKIERLIMPLARNGRDVDMLLGVTVLESALDRPARASAAAPGPSIAAKRPSAV
ncbi:MAG TPA: hypothetical protein VN832_13570 [Stellaceae bacterium]|nr:hypothetical protein [Stellaceae bacterium]